MRHLQMRHEQMRHSPSTIDRINSAVQTGQKIYGIAHAAYSVGRVAYSVGRAVAPYVAAAI